MDYIYNYPIQHTLPIAVFLCFITWAGLSGQKYFKSINHLTANLAGMCIGGSFSKCVFHVNRKSKMATIARHTLYGEMKDNFSKRINIWLNLSCSWITGVAIIDATMHLRAQKKISKKKMLHLIVRFTNKPKY